MSRTHLAFRALVPFAAGYHVSHLLRSINAVIAGDHWLVRCDSRRLHRPGELFDILTEVGSEPLGRQVHWLVPEQAHPLLHRRRFQHALRLVVEPHNDLTW